MNEISMHQLEHYESMLGSQFPKNLQEKLDKMRDEKMKLDTIPKILGLSPNITFELSIDKIKELIGKELEVPANRIEVTPMMKDVGCMRSDHVFNGLKVSIK
jgi:hypothetical protein